MGGFYGSIHLQTDDRDNVIRELTRVAKKQNSRFLIGPAINGWLSLYPENGGQDERISRSLSKTFLVPMIHVSVHNDDILAYWYYRDGKLIDQYNSLPDYFGEVTEHQRRKVRGKPELLRNLLRSDDGFEQIQALLTLRRDRQPVFAVESLERFATLLGLPNAVASYEYLQDGETDHIVRWDEFIHVPNLDGEQAAKQSKAHAINLAKHQLQSDKILFVDQEETSLGEGLNTRAAPAWSHAPNGGLFVLWSGQKKYDERTLELRLPPNFDRPNPTMMKLPAMTSNLCLSHSGRLLGVGIAGETCSVEIRDLSNHTTLSTASIRRAMEWIGFTQDETRFLAYSAREVTVIRIATGAVESIFETTGEVPCRVALHPSDTLVIGDRSGRLTLWDLASGQCIKMLCVGGQKMPEQTTREALDINRQFAIAALANNEWEQTMRKQFAPTIEMMSKQFQKHGPVKFGLPEESTLEDFVQRAQKNLEEDLASSRQKWETAIQSLSAKHADIIPLGIESVTCLAVSSCGKWLACGTEDGACIFEWERIELSQNREGLAPRFTAKGEPRQRQSRNLAMALKSFTQDVAFDSSNNALLFAGQEGVVRMVNLQDGRHSVLLDPPERLHITKNLLTSDASGLLCIAYDANDRKRPRRYQIWNYQKLSDRNIAAYGGTD